jgi:hypothetical protein
MTVTGRVLLKETGAGLSDLQVAFFLVDPLSTAEFTSALMAPPGAMRRHGGVRLGSVLTDTWGRFTFSVECGQPGADLVVAVSVPEQGPGRYGVSTVEVVCVPQAGQHETCLLRVHRQRLLEAGGILPESEVAARSLPGLTELLVDAKQGLRPVEGGKPDVPFSRTYQQRRREWQKLLADNSPPAPTLGPQNVRAFIITPGEASPQEAEVSLRPDGRVVVGIDDRPAPLLLRFGGAVYRQSGLIPKGGLMLELDEQAGTFRVVVPISDGELRAAEFPSALFYMWQAPRPPAPPPETPSTPPE